jgi:hypothetical protein
MIGTTSYLAYGSKSFFSFSAKIPDIFVAAIETGTIASFNYDLIISTIPWKSPDEIFG